MSVARLQQQMMMAIAGGGSPVRSPTHLYDSSYLGTTAYDIIGGADATMVLITPVIGGVDNDAFSYIESATQYEPTSKLSLPLSVIYPIGSFSGWCKVPATGGTAIICITAPNIGTGDRHFLYVSLNAAGTITCRVRNFDLAIDNTLTSAVSVPTPASWNHILVQGDGNTVEMYINGLPVAVTGTQTGHWVGDLTEAELVSVGDTQFATQHYGSTGVMDQIRITDFVYSNAEVLEMYNADVLATPAAVILDNFTDANGTALSAHTSDDGKAWVALKGAVDQTINNNILEGANLSIINKDLDSLDQHVIGVFTESLGSYLGLRTGNNGDDRLLISGDSGGNVRVRQFVNDIAISDATVAGSTSLPRTIEATVVADKLNVWQNGSLRFDNITITPTNDYGVSLQTLASYSKTDSIEAESFDVFSTGGGLELLFDMPRSYDGSSTLIDLSGNGRHGTVSGDHSLNVVKGGTLDPGNTGLFSAPLSPRTGDYTLIRYTYTLQAADFNQGITIIGDTGDPWTSGVVTHGRASGILYAGHGGSVTRHEIADVFVDGSWEMLALVSQGTTSKLYKDAVVVGELTMPSGGLNWQSIESDGLGGMYIHTIAVYSKALHQTEINNIFTKLTNRNYAVPVILDSFTEEGSGTILLTDHISEDGSSWVRQGATTGIPTIDATADRLDGVAELTRWVKPFESNDQRATLVTDGPQALLVLRSPDTDNYIFAQVGGPHEFQVAEYIGGVKTTLQPSTTHSESGELTVVFEVIGSTLSLSINGTAFGPWTVTGTSGDVGFWAHDSWDGINSFSAIIP